MNMNEDTLRGQWTQLKGKVREKWGKLTNDDLDQIQGRAQQLVGRIQERYGIARDEAERQVKEWEVETGRTTTPTR
jgi:uncharacterized protein YjbJ (UPF0337 family)